MKALQRVLFIIAFVFLSIHALRLTYQLWFEERTSALDAYAEAVETDIRGAASLEELVQDFDAAHKRVEEYEADENNPSPDYGERMRTEPFKSERKLRSAIESWERQSNEIARTRTYWVFGLIFLIFGIAVQKWFNPWVGIAALVVAFSEMIFWSSPPYFGGWSPEIERLLYNKLILTWVSLILLFAASFIIGTIGREKQRQ